MKEKKEKQSKLKKNIDWLITATVMTFILSLIFSYTSTLLMSNLNIVLAVLLLLIIIFTGVFFDIIAVAVTIAEEHNFHAKASKKIEGAKTSISLIRNSHKVSNFCADVIGDIAGVLSGSISAVLTFKITSYLGLDFDIQFLMSAIVAALTVGGKALGKVIAKEYSSQIVDEVSKFLTAMKINK